MGIGLVRTKAIAMLLGPAGIGLMAALNAIADLARTLTELGINNSGVRQIAEAAGSSNSRRIAVTVTVLRRLSLCLGAAGGLVLMLLAGPVASTTFGSAHFTGAVALLGLAVFLRLISDAQGAVLHGLRRIGDIAKVNVVSALFGTALAVAMIFAWGEAGVAPSIVGGALVALATSWWFSRRVIVEKIRLDATESTTETIALLRMGLAFMSSAMMTLGAAYLVRLALIRTDGLQAAGLYQAAWALGGICISFVLQAMGTDFYPRLVASASDNSQCNRIVNEQTQVSMLLASAGVVGTLTLAPWALQLLYTSAFVDAVDSLRWVCLGMALRVITWPLGYILIAKQKSLLFVAVDAIWSIANVALTVVLVGPLGVNGAGIAFFASYLLHLAIVLPICRRLSDFRWSATTAQLAIAFVAIVSTVQLCFLTLEPRLAYPVGLLALLLTLIGSMVVLRRLSMAEKVPPRVARLFRSTRP